MPRHEIQTITYATRPTGGHPSDPALATIGVDLLTRLPAVTIVGLPAASVRETADTVRSALIASGVDFPRKRVVVTVGPADGKHRNAELAIAVAILGEAEPIEDGRLSAVYHGSLRLDGTIRPVPGVLDAAILARAASLPLVCCADDADKVCAALAGVKVLTVRALGEIHERAIRAPLAVQAIDSGGGWHIAPTRPGSFHHEPKDLDPRVRAALVDLQPGHAVAFLSAGMAPTGIMSAVRWIASKDAPTMAAILAADRAGMPLQRTAPIRAPHHTIREPSAVTGELALSDGGWLILDSADLFRAPVMAAIQSSTVQTRIVLTLTDERTPGLVAPADLAAWFGATVVDLRNPPAVDDEIDAADEPTERIDRKIVGGGAW